MRDRYPGFRLRLYPGLPYRAPLGLGAVCWCLLTAVIALIGYVEQKDTPKWVFVLDMITSRLLPGLILVIIAVLAIGLGLYEIVAPQAFDEMGRGFLEVLFGVR